MENVSFRRARLEDLSSIIELLANDPLGAAREDISNPTPKFYTDAFEAINSDPNQLLAVITEKEKVIGTLQISFIPGLSRKGSWRGQIEAIRVARTHRSKGIGRMAFDWAIQQCRAKNCSLVQLTTDKTRSGAHQFYDDLGFVPSHIGYKKAL